MNNKDFYNAVQSSAKKLKLACIDSNLAPVVEMSDHSSRHYGSTPDILLNKADLFSKAMQSEGVKTVLKHFPGWNIHCNQVTQLNEIKLKVRLNSEVQKCSVLEKERKEFTLQATIFNKVSSNAWMVSNHIIEELGPYPSTMNPIINDLIRKDLNYKGLVISDALWEIEASPKAVLLALNVVDWVMVGHHKDAEIAIPYIRQAIKEGIIKESDIKEKLKRIEDFQNK